MDTVAEINRVSGEALARLYRAAPGYLARLGRNSALVLSGEACADLNYLLVGPEPNAPRIFREGIGVVRDRSLPVLALLTPHVAATLAGDARDLAMNSAGEAPIMVLQASEPLSVPAGFRSHRVMDASMLATAAKIQASAFGLSNEACARTFGSELLDTPGVDVFVTLSESTSMSAVQTVRSGSTVGIWTMATPPEHQRKGAGRALLAHVINGFLAQGVSRFYLGASAAGSKLYESLGFKTIAAWTVWSIGESTQVH